MLAESFVLFQESPIAVLEQILTGDEIKATLKELDSGGLATHPNSNVPSTLNPLYEQVRRYTTTIAADGDPADVYYPVLPSATADQLPIALMLQGALVDKADYSNYAEEVASYGFVVVVPNNERTAIGPDGQPVTGLLADEQQVNDVLNQMKAEDADAGSPIFEIVDTETLGLLGHSFGGYVGLAAIQGICDPRVCSGGYTRPTELKAGIFYGTNFQNPIGTFPAINNEDIPVGLVTGTLDGVAVFDEAISTYVKVEDVPKALIAVEGANHYGITNEDSLTRDPNRPTLDQVTATETIGRWSGLFLRAHLLDDRAAWDYVYDTGSDLDPNVNVIDQTPLETSETTLHLVALPVERLVKLTAVYQRRNFEC